MKLWKLKYRLRAKPRKVTYLVDGELLTIYRNGKKAVVYYKGRIVFTNIHQDWNFKDWWKKMKLELKDSSWTKLKNETAKEMEYAEVLKKTARIRNRPKFRK